MKRILAIILSIVMFSSLTGIYAKADIEIPAEPKVSASSYVYIANPASITYDDGSKPSDKNSGMTWDKAKSSWGNAGGSGAFSVVSLGGKIISVARAYIGSDYTFAATQTPVMLTAKDQTTDFRSGEIYNKDKTGNGSQRGTFIGSLNKTISFEGEFIFDDIDILVRESSFTMSVLAGGKLVIGNGTRFFNMSEANVAGKDYKTNSVNPTLNVDKGGYAFLHQAGFSNYIGEGTIIVDAALLTNKTVSSDTFASFAGNVVSTDGTVIVRSSEESSDSSKDTNKIEEPQITDKVIDTETDKTTQKATEKVTEKATENAADTDTIRNTTENSEKVSDDHAGSGIYIIIIASAVGVAAIALIIFIVVKKKAKG